MEYVNSFRDLEVYKLAREVAREIFFLVRDSRRKRNIPSQIRSEDLQGQSVHKLQKHGVKEGMSCISYQNLPMQMESNSKPNIG